MTNSIRSLFLLLLILATGQRATADSSSVLSPAEAAKTHFSAAPDWRPHAISLHPARWIWLPSQRTLPNTFVLFRKEIDLDSPPASARGWISADSRYRLTINGRRVQWGPAPCDPRTLDADPVDVKPFLKAGKNVIGVEVLFYGHGDGTWAGGLPGLLLNLNVETESGKVIPVLSDNSWQSRLDRAHPPGRYKRWFLRALQEEYDARLHPEGWDTPQHLPDREWIAAAELPCPPDKPPAACGGTLWAGDSVDRVDPAVASLRMRQIPLAREIEIAARRLAASGSVRWLRPAADWFDMRIPGSFETDSQPVAKELEAGVWELPATPGADQGVYATFEFDEQIAGFPYFTIDAPEGAVIEVMVQEGHDPSKVRWLDTYFFNWSRFICREGLNRFETFDFESFRWMQLHVRNASRPVVIREVGVRRRIFPWPEPPKAVTSEAPLQRLFDASINTLNNSAIELIMDGGGRERQQYSGDGGHQLHAIRYAFGERRLCARFLRTFSEGLTVDGYFMDCWPGYDRLARVSQKQINAAFWGPLLDHGVGFVFDNWHHYLETGDLAATDEAWPRLVRFAEYLMTLRDELGLLKVENVGIPTVWMDHNAYQTAAHKQCSFNLYTAGMYERALAPLAEARGDSAAATKYRQRGRELLAATVRRFWSQERSLFVDNLPWLETGETPRLSDRSLAMAVLFDQCPGGQTAPSVKVLAECPKEMGLSYPCNAGWRYWALAKGGRIDVVLDDLRNRWATMSSVIANNTLQESWTAATDGFYQWSHCPLAPLYVLHQDVAGIRPTAPGFARVQVRPQLGDLPDLELTSFTPKGAIHFQSRKQGDGHQVRLTLPPGCEGELLTPAEAKADLTPLAPDRADGLKRYRLPAGRESVFWLPPGR